MRISTNIVPIIALNLVSTLARRISAKVRLVRSSAVLTCPAWTRWAASVAVRPVAPVTAATLPGAPSDTVTAHDRGAPDDVLPASRSRDRSPLYPLRPARVSGLPPHGVGRFPLRRLRQGFRAEH